MNESSAFEVAVRRTGAVDLPRRRLPRIAAVAVVLALALGVGAGSASASSLRYFGYFAARLTASGGNHLPEVAGRSNLDWIQISDPDRYAPEVLDSCASHGCIVNTGFEFFRGCEEVHSPHCELYPDYVARWERLAEAVRSRIEKVGAFYLLDEPQWHGATPAELETAALEIKRTFPGIPVMMVEAGPQVTSSLQVPAAVDWVGFDWYCQPFSTVERTLSTLTGRINPNQSLILLMESAPLPECGGAPGHATDAQIAALQSEYFRLATGNPRVIGLLAFGFWTSGLGSAQLPLTVTTHEAIYRQIVPPAPPPPLPPPPSPSPAPPPRLSPVRIGSGGLTGHSSGSIAVPLLCPRANTAACTGHVSLELIGHTPRPIGAGGFTLARGRHAAVHVEVKRRLRASLLHHVHGKRKKRIRVSAVTAAGEATAVLPLRIARQRRHA
jgi:hypothetical protein